MEECYQIFFCPFPMARELHDKEAPSIFPMGRSHHGFLCDFSRAQVHKALEAHAAPPPPVPDLPPELKYFAFINKKLLVFQNVAGTSHPGQRKMFLFLLAPCDLTLPPEKMWGGGG